MWVITSQTHSFSQLGFPLLEISFFFLSADIAEQMCFVSRAEVTFLSLKLLHGIWNSVSRALP